MFVYTTAIIQFPTFLHMFFYAIFNPFSTFINTFINTPFSWVYSI